MWRRFIVVTLLIACGNGLPVLGSDASTADVKRPCDSAKPFDAPVRLAGVALPTTAVVFAPTFTSDELTMYFAELDEDAGATGDILSTTRADLTTPFGTATLVSALNTSSSNDTDPALSADALTMYFYSDRANGPLMGRIYMTLRPSLLVDFGAPTLLASVNSSDSDDVQPTLDWDGSLVFASTRPGGLGNYDLFRAQKSASGFDAPIALIELNSSTTDWSPALTKDGLTIYFASARASASWDIFVATRPNVTASFSMPVMVSELSSPDNNELPHWVSPDSCRLYFTRLVGSDYAVFVASHPSL